MVTIHLDPYGYRIYSPVALLKRLHPHVFMPVSVTGWPSPTFTVCQFRRYQIHPAIILKQEFSLNCFMSLISKYTITYFSLFVNKKPDILSMVCPVFVYFCENVLLLKPHTYPPNPIILGF